MEKQVERIMLTIESMTTSSLTFKLLFLYDAPPLSSTIWSEVMKESDRGNPDRNFKLIVIVKRDMII